MAEDDGTTPALTVGQIVERQRALIGEAQGDKRPIGIRELSRRIQDRDPSGKGISHYWLSTTLRGLGGVSVAATLARIARGCSVTDTEREAQQLYAELMAASGRSEAGPLAYEFTERRYELTRRELQAVDSFINAMAAARERGALEAGQRLAQAEETPEDLEE